jgi:hypothetical protein
MNVLNIMEFAKLSHYRGQSKGWQHDPISCVYPRIFVGAGCQFTQTTAYAGSFTHVINCAFREDGPEWFAITNPERYAVLGAVDSLDVSILDWYPAFEKVMLQFLRDPACKNVYVHCQCGINRSAYLAMTFVCRRFGFPLAEVSRSLVTQRPCALTNPVFWTQVSAFLKPLA